MQSAGFSRRTMLQMLGGAALGSATMGSVTYAASSSLDQIKKSGILRVGCEAVLPPFTFREGGKIVGYDVDVANLISKPLGVKPQMIDTAWAGVIPALYAGRFDIIMSQMTYTKERLGKVGFSIPYVEASLAMLVRVGDVGKIKTVNDLVGRTIGVELGSPGEVLAKSLDEQWKKSGKSFASIRIYDDYPSSYLALGQGSVDAVLNAVSALGRVIKDAPGKYAIVQGVGAEKWAGIATQKEDTALVSYLDEQLRKMKASGEIYSLQEKWFGVKMKLPDAIPTL